METGGGKPVAPLSRLASLILLGHFPNQCSDPEEVMKSRCYGRFGKITGILTGHYHCLIKLRVQSPPPLCQEP